MLQPGHPIDLPEQYIKARAHRSFARLYRWLMLVMALGFIIFAATLDVFPLMIAVLAVGCGAIILVSRCQVRRALLRHRGQACPCCGHRSGDPKPGCKGCESPAGRHAHRVYWRLKRLSLLGAEQWFSDQFRIENIHPPITRMIKVIIGSVVAIPLLAASYVVLITILFNDLSWLGGLGMHSWFWMFYFAATFGSGYFAKRRIGKTLHCTACEYQLAPVGPRPDTCPECGAGLSRAGAVSEGRQIGSRWSLVLPIVVFTLIASLPILNLWTGWRLSASNLVPTRLLVDHIIATEDIDYQLEREIETRALDDGHLSDLLDEMERRMQAGACFGITEQDSRYWGMNVADLIAAEAGRRSLPHPIKARLLTLSRAWEDEIPFDLERLVDSDIQAGVFSQAELQAAEMLRPIKQVLTGEFVQQIVSAEDMDWEVWQEIQTRRLEDEHLVALLDEMQRRLADSQDPGLLDDPTGWRRRVGDLVLAEVSTRAPSRSVSLRLLSLALTYQGRLPYRLRDWIRQAELTGQLNIDEPAPETDHVPERE